MKLFCSVLFGLAFVCPNTFAHRLDEYLQATLVRVEEHQIDATMRLVPGQSVANKIKRAIDLDHDGANSAYEKSFYAKNVLNDLSLILDGQHVIPELIRVNFPSMHSMTDGSGEIQIEFRIPFVPRVGFHTFQFENRHFPKESVYLVNALSPESAQITIQSQNRNRNQSRYELIFRRQENVTAEVTPSGWIGFMKEKIHASGFSVLFRLGMKHIAEGTDHLLFLLTLLIPVPLLADHSRWEKSNTVKRSLIGILKVATAFTLGHSITLIISAFNFVSVPARPVEVFIAVSIFISAIHAVRPLFPKREAIIGFLFGLIHGLAFAETFKKLGFGIWERSLGIFSFNLGIETMQIVVILAVLPSMILLSRTKAYRHFRIVAASFAGFASLGWIVERTFAVPTSVDSIVDFGANHGIWIAVLFFLISLFYFSYGRIAVGEKS